MDDDTCHPDKPTEPPNEPKGTTEQGDGLRAQSRVERGLREATEATDSNETRRPRKPTELPDKVESPHTRNGELWLESVAVQFYQGDELTGQQNRSVTHESTDMEDHKEVGGECREAQVDGEIHIC